MIIRRGIPNATAGFDYQPKAGWRKYFAGIDLGTRQDHTATVVIEETVLPLMEWAPDTWEQRLSPPSRVVVSAERLKLKLDWAVIASYIARLQNGPPLDDPDSLFMIDCTGVGAAVASLLREREVVFQSCTWTSSDTFKHHHVDGWRVGKSYLLSQLGAAFSSSKLQILEELRDAEELKKQLTDYAVDFTAAGNMTMNAPAGAHDDYCAATAMAWFAATHAATSLGPPSPIDW